MATANQTELAELFASLADVKQLSGYAADAIMLRWTAIDPLAAIAHARKNPAAHRAIGATMWAWAKNDPERAIAYGIEHGIAGPAVRAIAQDDPAYGEKILAEHPELDVRTVREGMVNGLVRTDDLSGALYALEAGLDSEGALKRFAQSDPSGALDLALKRGQTKKRSEAVAEVLSSIADNEGLESALELASTLPSRSLRATKVAELMEGYAQTDPVFAEERAREFEQPFDRSLALVSVANALTASDPDKALSLLGETSIDLLLQSRKLRWEAERSSGSSSAPLSNEIQGVNELVETLIHSRPVETMELLNAAGDSSSIRNLQETAAQNWVESAPEEASSWIGTLPSGSYRDTLVDGLTHSLIYAERPDFESALAWTLTIDPDQQRTKLKTLFRRWEEHDAEAAIAAMARAVETGGDQ